MGEPVGYTLGYLRVVTISIKLTPKTVNVIFRLTDYVGEESWSISKYF